MTNYLEYLASVPESGWCGSTRAAAFLDVLAKRLNVIVQTPQAKRYGVLAEGLELLADSVATLAADGAHLAESGNRQSAAVLYSFAEEEAAKILIVLDLARCGWQNQALVKACLKNCYNHLSRGLYVTAYERSPADLAEVRRYLDQWRSQYYLDGPMEVDWIFGNWVITNREEALYADYVQDEHGNSRWTGPAERVALYNGFDYPVPAGRVVRLVAAMWQVGLLTEAGLTATHAAWDGVLVDDAMHWSDLQPITAAALMDLAAQLGRDYSSDEDKAAIAAVLDQWIFPLSELDLSMTEVDPDDLKRARALAR